jgi:hypothetical protein
MQTKVDGLCADRQVGEQRRRYPDTDQVIKARSSTFGEYLPTLNYARRTNTFPSRSLFRKRSASGRIITSSGSFAASVSRRSHDIGIRSPRCHLDDALGLPHDERLCVGIGGDEVDALQPGRNHVVDGIAAGTAYPNTIMRAFISRISVKLGIFGSRLLRRWGMRTRIATYKPCGLLPLWSRLDVPVGVQLVRDCRSSRRLGHRSAEPPPRLQVVPSRPWLP